MEEPGSESKQPVRLMSVDALRGFDMFWIIGGSTVVLGFTKALNGPLEWLAPQFEHVSWSGLHFFDLIWPLFMFVVGVSIPLSIEKRKSEGSSRRSLYIHAVRRSVVLFILGMVVQGGLLYWDADKLRPCYSVLHGIAAGYMIAFVVAMEFRQKMQIFIMSLFLLLYWAALEFIPVPGIGSGVLTPEGNAAIWIDKMVLGRFHYGQNTWFLSYPGFASSVLMGVIAGNVLMMPYVENKKVLILAGTGLACLILSLAWSAIFPVIKLLWTSTFVLAGGGYGFLMLALFYWIIDVKKIRRWAFFFTVIGMNSIAVYLAIMLVNFRQIGNIFVGGLLPRTGAWDDFVSASAAVVIIWLILYWMYRTKTFIKL